MLLSDISIKRPVFATVLSLLLIAFGLVSYERLSLREYPDIDPPIVTVEVNYPGAPASIVETRITELVESRIAGIGGIEFISSRSRDGRSQVTIEFSVNTDVDAAANDVRDRISGLADNLPEDAEPPEVQKADSSDDVIIWRNLTSDRMTVPELTDYANRYLIDKYTALDGVARVRIGGGLRYAMRIWLDRQEMAARGLTVSDVRSALRSENVELPAGSLESDERLFRARVDRNFNTPEDFKGLVIAEGDDGYLIRLEDISDVTLGVVEDRVMFRGNEVAMVGIGTVRQSTANTLDVTNAVVELTKQINQDLPEGMKIEESYNAAVFIKASIDEVFKTLAIAILCVIVVIYLFLGSTRVMLIPAITVPISLVATFIVMYSAGFSINLLTLLALVLAIGLVVDDAIVMLENISRRIQDLGESPLVAAYRGARQVGFAVIATTLVLIAVFLPITFLEGDIGRLFTEFAITISAAVVFSSFVALTLCPMLASKILKSNEESRKPPRFIQSFDRFVDSIRSKYVQSLRVVLTKPLHASLVFIALIAGSWFIYPKIAQEFTPYEDRGSFFVSVRAPEGASYSYVKEYMEEIETRLMTYVDSGEIKRLLVRAPGNFSRGNFNTGRVIIILHDWSERRPAAEIMAEIRENLADLPGVRVSTRMRQGLSSGGGNAVQFVLGGSTYEELDEWKDIILQKVEEDNPGFKGLDGDFRRTRPQIEFDVDYERAADLGVTVADIGATLQTMMGGSRITTLIDRGEEYDVIVEGKRDEQRSFTDVSNIYVRSDRTGELIPLSNIVTVKEYGAAESLWRYNRVRTLTLSSNLEDGYRLGDALAHLRKLVREHLPPEVVIDYKGQSRDFIESGSSMQFVFGLGLLVVFLVLAAQFESFRHPLIIMLTVPLAIGGGILGLFLTDNSINIYSQIGLIMLVGLASKNGILIVEFANQLRDQGMAFAEALEQACLTRLRPILMTGLTTVAGAVPLVLSSGAGAETRMVIGVVVLFGVFIATILTVYIVPIAYNIIARGTGSPNDISRAIDAEEGQSI